MALEVLKGIKEVGGFKVCQVAEDGRLVEGTWKEPIYIRHDENTLVFTLQKGPIKEVGVNGCQIDTLIEVAQLLIEKHNEKFPDPHNTKASNALHEALFHLEERRKAREARGVEGTNQT